MTIVIHSSHKIQYSQTHFIFPLCQWLRHPPVSQTASLTPLCAPNQPSYCSIPLNHIFTHSLDHQVLDSSQPAVQPVSQSCTLYALSQASIHSSKEFFVPLAQQSVIQPFSQPISHSFTHSPTRAVTQQFALLVSISHPLSHVFCQSLIPSSNKPATLSIFHTFTQTARCSVSQSVSLSLFRSHSQLLCQSFFHSFTHSLGVLSVILSLFRPLSRSSASHSFTLSPTQ